MEIINMMNFNFWSELSIGVVVVEVFNITNFVDVDVEVDDDDDEEEEEEVDGGWIPFKQYESQLIFSIESGVLKWFGSLSLEPSSEHVSYDRQFLKCF